MEVIAYVKVYLDDDVPEYMEGIIRVGSVEIEDEGGNVLSSKIDLVDNAEFQTERDLREYVAKKLGVSVDIIDVVG